MKLSAALLLTSVVSAAANLSITGHKAAAKVLRAARKLDGQDAQEEQEFSYLANYALKMVACKAGETVVNPENGEYEYSAVVLRLCPADSCDSDSTKGCSSGYGDMVVGMNTFVQAYFEDQKDNMNWDDNFQVDRYAECNQYDVEDVEDDQVQQQRENWGDFFIGPACDDEGLGIKLDLFQDEACTYKSEIEFETISNGWTMPFSSGGLVSTACSTCLEYNDNGEQELREMCMETYQNAGAKCEEKMEYFSYYGQNVAGCEYIAQVAPSLEKGTSGWAIFGWIILALVIVGAIGYVVWWRKKKAAASDGLMN